LAARKRAGSVLRAIPLAPLYEELSQCNLVFNPRTRSIFSGLMKNLRRGPQKLMGNKEVADTIRKMAMRTYKQRRAGQ
jgi:hypothetical protein